MNIKRNGSQASGKGNTDWFTGTVRIDQPFQAEEPARVGGATVTFEPGARTAWHTHPLGQTLLVTAGLGWAQRENGPLEEIRPGDVVVVRAWGKALARSFTDYRYDPHRSCRKARRQVGRLDGTRDRCSKPKPA